jgi:hypothetical protein
MAHPVSEAAERRVRLAVCRCPDAAPTLVAIGFAPCRMHPFAFDYETLLSPRQGKAW